MSNETSEPDIVTLSKSNLARKDSDADTDGDGVDEWIPYIGDRGGEGWQTADGQRTVYTDDPPGDKIPPEEALVDVVGLGVEEVDAVGEGLQSARESDALSEESAFEAVAQHLARRQSKHGDVLDADSEEIKQFAESVVEREVQEAEELAGREAWEDVLYNNMEDEEDARLESQFISDQIDDIAQDLNVDFDEVAERVNEKVSEQNLTESMGSDSRLPVDAVHDAVREVGDELEDETVLLEMVDTEIKDAIEKDPLDKDAMVDFCRSEFGFGSEEWDAVSSGPGEFDASTLEQFEAAVENMVDASDMPKADLAQELNDWADNRYFPFRDHGGSIDDALDPANADVVKSFGELGMGGGRSSSSMYVAEGVSDEDGNERRLFITNTNPDRGRAEKADDGERCVAGSSGFAAAGIPVPRYANVMGEFWVAEDAGGKKAGDSSVDHTDLDQPVEQFVEMMAVGSVLGATDLHQDNVHADPETGKLIPVDLDLIGAETHHDADSFRDNRYFDQQDMRNRSKRTFDALDMGEVADYSDVWEAVQKRTKQMQDDGTLNKVAVSATNDSRASHVNDSIRRNLDRFKQDDFWLEDVDPPDGGMDAIRDDLGLEKPDDEDDAADLQQQVDSLVDSSDIENMDQDQYEDAVTSEPEDEPFLDYDGCVDYHDDKDDPEAYCAVIFGFNESTVSDGDDEDEDEEGDFNDEINSQLSEIGL